ncbi:MAG: tRNA (N6-threonylcarbamoyladenosine(37)-N6)-methyltransferase TrmO [Myxococcota bacterium]|jgi:tRNA-Thr(GGU) m(6)t(6)A37 methyltransferase TsaA|nr:tRNA (N6-threonylcarbamoyladenosine(37)-N6)-methyltransferase TrmO [Myxococcota bacterium]
MMESMQRPAGFTFRPIGWVRSPYARRIDAPHQGPVTEGTETGAPAEAIIEIDASIPLKALEDLAGFERLWILFVFHQSKGFAPKVRPPRGRGKRGVLATRAPDRPNPIGLSAVELLRIEGRELAVRAVDILDGTPVLDIKPYVPYADAFPLSRAGWIDEVDALTGVGFAPGPKRPR